jgi:hypothetical protein
MTPINRAVFNESPACSMQQFGMAGIKKLRGRRGLATRFATEMLATAAVGHAFSARRAARPSRQTRRNGDRKPQFPTSRRRGAIGQNLERPPIGNYPLIRGGIPASC